MLSGDTVANSDAALKGATSEGIACEGAASEGAASGVRAGLLGYSFNGNLLS
jgi:hypothetical protein